MRIAYPSRPLIRRCLAGLWLITALQPVPAMAAAGPVQTEMPKLTSTVRGRPVKPMPCEPPSFGRDKLSVTCALDSAAGPRAFHIKVHLTGSHDDTTASLEVTLGETPVVCDAGSKTSTESEDGDVTLDCRFSVPHRPGASTLLRIGAKWFHAQYVNLEVNGVRPD